MTWGFDAGTPGYVTADHRPCRAVALPSLSRRLANDTAWTAADELPFAAAFAALRNLGAVDRVDAVEEAAPNGGREITIHEFATMLADVCETAAALVLQGATPTDVEDVEAPERLPYEADRRHFLEVFETDEPSGWIGLVTSTYLVESAHLCVAVAELLRSGAVAIAVDPLVRAIIERIGKVVWVLDPSVEARVRAARAGLEIAVCTQHYRTAVDQLSDSNADKKATRDDLVAIRDRLEELFEVVKPPSDPCDESSDPTPTVSEWTLDGERYPNYAEMTAKLVAPEGPRRKGVGSYGGLSGFSHPNVVFSREHRHIAADGSMTYSYSAADLEKDTRFAAFILLDGARHWASYNEAGRDALQDRIDQLGDVLDAASVLVTPTEPETPEE